MQEVQNVVSNETFRAIGLLLPQDKPLPLTLIQISAIILVGALLILFWWRLFRKPALVSDPFPEEWRKILQREVQFYRELNEQEKASFERRVQQFLHDVTITGVEVDVDETDKILVAASAVIPVFRFPEWRYGNINEVLLYGGSFNQEYETAKGEGRNILGMVGEGSMQRMMILSKPSLRLGFEQEASKSHVGIHEFVHLLDKSDGSTDGIPELFLEKAYIIPWVKIMHKELQDIRDGESDINPYGSKNEAEFLSVVSEYFFKRPDQMAEQHPELFVMLERIFRTV